MKQRHDERWRVAEQRACHRAGAGAMHRAIALLVLMVMPFASLSANESKLYEVRDGNKVDTKTLNGWKTWRALACERCHGARQEGLVGPPLVESMKRLSMKEFEAVMMNGRPEKGMPPFNTSEMVTKNLEGLYAYLKGRADGEIQPGRLSPLD